MWAHIYLLTLLRILSSSAEILTMKNSTDRSVIHRFAIEAMRKNGIASNPSTVAAFLCMEKDETVLFTRLASKNDVLISVNNPLDGSNGEIFLKDRHRHQSYYLVDIDCPGAFDVLRQANSSGMFISPAKWLLLQDIGDNYDIVERQTASKSHAISYSFFGKLSLFPDSNVMIGQRIARDHVKLISIYKPSPVRDLVVEDHGFWKDGKGLYLRPMQVSAVRRKDLQLTPLKSCLVVTDPDTINHLTDYQNRHIDPITKVNYPWILFLGEMMNATISFNIVDSWGYRDANNSWNGMIGLLDRKEIDLGGTATFFTADRIDVIEYISLYTPTRSKFIFRRLPLSYVSNIFVLPFRPTVWLASGIFLILVALLLYIAWKWEWHTSTPEEREKPYWAGNMIRVSWSDNILIIIGAVSQQGSTFEPRGVTPRIIILMLFVAVVSLYTSYAANIVALLQSSTGSINSLDKLLHSSLKFGVHDSVYSRYYFAAFQDPIRRAIYQQKVAPQGQKPVWMTIEDGAANLKNGLFAFHAETGAAYKVIQETFQEDEKCGFQELDFLHVIDPLLPIQKRSPYLEIIKYGALKIHESGLQTRHITRLYTKKPVCHGHTSFVSVGLIDCYAAFGTLAWGLLAAVTVLFMEILWHKREARVLDEIHAISVED